MGISTSMLEKYEQAQVTNYLPQDYFNSINAYTSVNLDFLLGLSNTIDRDKHGYIHPVRYAQENYSLDYTFTPEYRDIHVLINEIISKNHSKEDIDEIRNCLKNILDRLD